MLTTEAPLIHVKPVKWKQLMISESGIDIIQALDEQMSKNDLISRPSNASTFTCTNDCEWLSSCETYVEPSHVHSWKER